ncbi:hypothetical protein CPC08DRAFT_613634, partial [Agrocybe pediades]
IERMMEKWNTAIYALWYPVPDIGYDDGRRYHEFTCFKKSCKKKVRRFLDTKDATSTGNLHKHSRKCWGEDIVELALNTTSTKDAREALANCKDGSVAEAFKIRGKPIVTYSHRQHTSTETRPYTIVKDRGFMSLMKTGRPNYYIPSPSTVSRDVRVVFARSRQRIATMLQKHDGKLHFATDAWTSPNHRAFVAVTVHFEHKGIPICLILDVVEVAKSHTGVNLAVAF